MSVTWSAECHQSAIKEVLSTRNYPRSRSSAKLCTPIATVLGIPRPFISISWPDYMLFHGTGAGSSL